MQWISLSFRLLRVILCVCRHNHNSCHTLVQDQISQEYKNLLEDFFDIIFYNLKKSNKVKIAKFGTFHVRFKKSRFGRNPKTKEKKIIFLSANISFFSFELSG